ncbi:hypothetical protein CRE_07253 [Caenorhabditis remanei]|uniref:Uncharacterized protein n=1 Tax=Caenorhabditis remanei TaxID=31234 RepID=E3M2C4_CAERE|nr:hypothetical protein CRE_07253 [Caenorhabditis remanei]
MAGNYLVTPHSKDPIHQMEAQEEVRIEIYPSIGTVEHVSFYTRFKKFIANTVANMICGVANHPYTFFVKNAAPENMQTVQITLDFPPV